MLVAAAVARHRRRLRAGRLLEFGGLAALSLSVLLTSGVGALFVSDPSYVDLAPLTCLFLGAKIISTVVIGGTRWLVYKTASHGASFAGSSHRNGKKHRRPIVGIAARAALARLAQLFGRAVHLVLRGADCARSPGAFDHSRTVDVRRRLPGRTGRSFRIACSGIATRVAIGTASFRWNYLASLR